MKKIFRILFVVGVTSTLLFSSLNTDVKSDEKVDVKETTQAEDTTEKETVKDKPKSDKNKEDSDKTETSSNKKEKDTEKKDTEKTENKNSEETKVEEPKEQPKESIKYKEYTMPSTRGFKSYMSYKAITSTSSPQYKLQSTYAYTGKYGIRQVDDRYCIAIGTFSGASIGTYVDLVLKNGTVIPCIIGDFKANAHTDSRNMMTSNGCVSEFIVDTGSFNTTAKKMGDASYCNDSWKNPVKSIKVYDKNVFK